MNEDTALLLNPHTVLMDILTIAEYPEDKETFIKDFFDLCLNKQLSDIYESLPEEKKPQFMQDIQQNPSADALESALNKYISEDEQANSMAKATEYLFLDCLKTLRENLTPEKNKEIDDYLEKFVHKPKKNAVQA